MPTTITKIVDPDNGSGTDYTSLSAWEAGQQENLVSNDHIQVAECRSTSGTADTTALTVAGSTVDSTHYLVIQSTGAHRHTGIWDTSKFRLSSSAGLVINAMGITSSYLRILGIQAEATGGGHLIDSKAPISIAGCILRIHGAVDVGSAFGIRVQDGVASQTSNVFNNLITADGTSDPVQIIIAQNNGFGGFVANIENNTLIYTGGGGVTRTGLNSSPSGATFARNNLLQGFGNSNTYAGTFETGSDYNTTDSSDSLGTGSNNRTSQTFSFTNSGSGDYSLTSSDSGGKHRGTSSVSGGFTADILGVSRNAYTPWDCGCFQSVDVVAKGTFTLTGISAGLKVGRRVNGAKGTFALTGTAAGLKTARKLLGGKGTFALTGVSAGLKTARKLLAGKGSFAVSGSAALLLGHKLNAAKGSYSLTGIAAALVRGRTLHCSLGLFTLSGSAGLVHGRTLHCSAGSFAVSGGSAVLRTARKLLGAEGSYALTGFAVPLAKGRRVQAGKGAFALTGAAASLRTARKLLAAKGTLSVTGIAAGLRVARKLNTTSGVFVLTGVSAGLSVTARVLRTAPGTFVLSGQSTLRVARYVRTTPGDFVLTGRAIGLHAARRLVASHGQFTVAGHALFSHHQRGALLATLSVRDALGGSLSATDALSGTLRTGRSLCSECQ